MTRILITNDDGIDAAGLAPLARRFRRAGLDPVIAAPASQSSGSSASIMAAQSDGRLTAEDLDQGAECEDLCGAFGTQARIEAQIARM